MYSALTDILERLPERVVIQLTDDDATGVVVTDKVDAAITRADKEIDAWCGARYTVPFVAIPPVVVELSADMAVYFLYSRTQDEIPQARIDGYKNAVNLLKAISKGEVSLGVAETPAATTGDAPEITSAPRLFNRNSLRNM